MDISTFLLVLAAVITWINARFLHWPPILAIVLGSLGISYLLILGDAYPIDLPIVEKIIEEIGSLRWDRAYLNELIAYFLFAGALRIDISELRQERVAISILATVSVFLFSIIFAVAFYYLAPFAGFPITWSLALLFGICLSPTDPVVVMDLFKRASLPRKIQTRILGESLFNDGASLILYASFLNFFEDPNADLSVFLVSFIKNILISFPFGYFFSWLIRRALYQITRFEGQVIITLGLVSLCFDITSRLGGSGAVSTVLAGLLFHKWARKGDLPDFAYKELYDFWALFDELLNVFFFLIVGMQFVNVHLYSTYGLVAILAVILNLVVRYISVFFPIKAFQLFSGERERAYAGFMSLAGLKGGISLALVLGLHLFPGSEAVTFSTFIVVIVSILVQPLLLKLLLRKP